MSTASETTAAAASGASEAWGLRLRQLWAVARLDVRRIRRGRHAWARILLLLLPFVAVSILAVVLIHLADEAFVETLVVRGERHAPQLALTTLARGVWTPFLGVVLYLAQLELFGNLVRGELSERTLHHLFLQPVRREVTVVGKYVAGVLTLGVLGSGAWMLTFLAMLAPHGPGVALATLFSADGLRHVALYLTAILLSTLAYGGLFLLAGLLRVPFLLGIALWIWEAATTILPESVRVFTVAHYLEALRPVPAPPEGLLAQTPDPAPLPVAILVPILVAAVSVTAAAFLARRVQLSYGANE